MRLGVKMMEADVVGYDHTVRDGTGRIVQFQYNGTGLDPKLQALAGSAGAFRDIPGYLDTWWDRNQVPQDCR